MAMKEMPVGVSIDQAVNNTAAAVDAAVMEKLIAIALKRGGEFADIFVEYAIANAILLEENKIRQAQTGISAGVGIRVIIGEKIGYAYSDSFEFEHLKKAAETASYIAESNYQGKLTAFNTSPAKAKRLSPIENPVYGIAPANKSELLWRINKAAYAADRRITQVTASIGDAFRYTRIANSQGVLIDNQESGCRINGSVIAEDGSKRQTGYHGAGGHIGFDFFNKFTPESIAQEAVRVALVRLDARPAPAGQQEVVLGNGWAGILLHEAVGHGLEADFNRKKTSLYSGRIGQKVASDLVTVIDDGTIPNLRGTINMDDEGAPPQKNVLIEKGILRGYLTDYLNGVLLKTGTTGSGRRESYKHYPLPRMTNTFMAAGESSPEDIIKSVKKGFYAKSFGGGQVDISNGQFVFEVTEGYLIEDGKITAPVKGASLIGNGPQILERVVMVGNDFEFDTGIGTCGKNGQSAAVGIGMPTCKISEITVGGTEIGGASMTEGRI